jgi:NAD(P)-dependent dehydrogenase (short-subunit alcohol dehydrogenase family)
MSGAFAGRSVLIVGCATGLGAEAARQFAAAGAMLTLVDLNASALGTLAETLRMDGVTVEHLAGDASRPETAEAAVARALAAHGRLDVLFNNAGIDPLSATTVVHTTPAQWDAVMAVNVGAAFLFSRAAIPLMASAGGGTIVNTASVAGLKPGCSEAAYNVSKAALVQLTRSIALDQARQGIRCNCICPGFLEAVMADRAAQMDATMLRERARLATAAVPLGRQATYAEVARHVLFLADPAQSAYVTGTAVTIDGGLLLT